MLRSQKIATIIPGPSVVLWLIHEVRPDRFLFNLTCPAIVVFTGCEGVVCRKGKRGVGLLSDCRCRYFHCFLHFETDAVISFVFLIPQ